MRFKYLTSILLLVALLSLQMTVHAQETPTLIYATGYETTPLVPDSYGNLTTAYPEEWASDCGIEDSACIYNDFNSYYDGGRPSAVIAINQNAPNTEVEVGMSWEACVINYIEFDVFYTTNAVGGEEDSYMFFVMDDDGSSSIETSTSPNDWSFSQRVDFADVLGDTEGEWWRFAAVLDNDQPMNSYTIEIRSALDNITALEPPPVMEIKIDNIEIWCDYPAGNLVRPLAAEDEHPLIEMFDTSSAEDANPDNLRYDTYPRTVHAFSSDIAAPVHSAVNGEVTALAPLDPGADCDLFGLVDFESELFPDSPKLCYVFIPEEVSGIGGFDIPNDGNLVYRVNLEDAWFVTIEAGGFFLDYIVSNTTVQIGDILSEGCVLGNTVELIPVTNPAESDAVLEEIFIGNGGITDGQGNPLEEIMSGGSPIGWTGILKYSTPPLTQLPLYPDLMIYPNSDNPCGNTDDPLLEGCFTGDPGLTDPVNWQVHGTYQFNDPGFTLASGSWIQQTLALDDSTNYSMHVRIRVVSGTSIVRLQLGQSVGNFTVSTGGIDAIQGLTLASALHDADLTEYWSARVTNIGPGTVEIVSVCVREGDAVTEPPSSCYFVNPSFESNNHWDVTSSVVERDGSLGVPDTESISQEITLPAGEYTLSVKTYVWYDGTPTTRLASTTDTMSLEYEWDGSGPTAMDGPDGTTLTPFSWFWARMSESVSYRGEYTADFTVADETTATISITAVIDTEASGIYGAGFDLACIRIQGEDGEINESCTEVTMPQDENLSSWTVWGWGKLNGFFQCELMPMLTKIKDLINNLYQLTGWQVRYWKATAYSGMNWLKYQLFPWLNGHFRNMAIGNVTVIQNGNAQCDWVQVIIGVLTGGCGSTGLFDILNNFFSGINATIQAMFSFLTSFFGGVGLFDLISQIINQLLAPIINTILNLLNIGVFLLFNVILQIVQSAFYLFNQAIALIGVMFSLFYGLIAAYNAATPQTIPGVPQCVSDPQNSSFCMMLWVAQHTVFSGTGTLWIPLVIAFGAIRTVFWSIREFKAVLNNTGAMI